MGVLGYFSKTVLAASAQVLPFFLRPFSLMSVLELTGRLLCPGSGCVPLPAAPCTAFPAVPGKVGEKGSRTGEATQRGSGRGGAQGGGNLRGGRSCCRCHCYRRCHIGFLLYRQPLWSCDPSRAAVTTVRSRPRERARTCARPQTQGRSRLSEAIGHAPALPVSGHLRAHARDGGPPKVCGSNV